MFLPIIIKFLLMVVHLSSGWKTYKVGRIKPDHYNIVLQRQIDATDHQIDRLLYELYGLTEEEIKIVERT